MTTKQTNYYFKFTDEKQDRLDFNFNHPSYEPIMKELNKLGCINLSEILSEDIVTGTQPKYDDNGEVLVIKTINMKNRFIDYENTLKATQDFYENNQNGQLHNGDILIASIGVGSIGKIDLFNSEEKAIFDGINLNAIRIDADKYNRYFLINFLRCRLGQKQIERLTQGSTGMIYISTNNIRDLQIPNFSTKLQKEIIDKIKKINKETDKFESKFQENLSMANTTLFNELKIDLSNKEINYYFKKGRENNSNYYYMFDVNDNDRLHYLFFHPKLEVIDAFKKKYKTIYLKDICSEIIHRGKQPEYNDFGIMVIKTVDLKNLFIDYKNTLKVTQDFFESKPQAHIKKGDILIASTGYVSLGKVDVFNRDESAFADGHISIVRLKDDYDPYFVTYFLRSSLGQLQFEKWFTGSSGQIEVQPSDLEKFIIPDIILSKQKEIGKKITDYIDQAILYKKEAEIKSEETIISFEKLIAS